MHPSQDARLSRAQIQAASHTLGPMVVFAGAGSGKTRVITYRIANLVATEHVPPFRILAVTFTNKAAGEMRHRLEGIMGEELTRELWVGTFHAIASKILRRNHAAAGLAKNFLIYDDDDQRAVMNRIYKDLRIDDKKFPVRQVLGRIHKEKQEGVTAEAFTPGNFLEDTIAKCFRAYDERLAAASAVDFDDLLIKMVRLAEGDGPDALRLRQRFSHVLVDEFQDVNRIQYRLVKALSDHTGNLCVVGDDDQSIYRWRGADVRIVRNFRKDHPGAVVVKLEENYRSTSNIVAAALAVIRPAMDREPKELFTSNPSGEPVRVVMAVTERDEAAFIAERLGEHIASGGSPKEMAVFYRVHAQSRVLEEVLRRERIPYQVIGGMRFFERAEIKDLVAYLRLVANPESDVDFARIVNVPARKIGDATVDKLAAFARENSLGLLRAVPRFCEETDVGTTQKKALSRFFAMVSDWSNQADTASPMGLGERILTETGYKRALELEGSDEAEARLQNLAEFLSSIGEFEEDMLAQGETPNLAGFLERVALSSVVDELKDAPKVSLMTVHAAKGLEFNHVFLAGMEEDLFPFRSQDPTREGDLEEERRLAYVAVTRARKTLALLYVERRMVFGTTRYNLPSRFLADLPREVLVTESTELRRTGSSRFIDRPLGMRTSDEPIAARPKLAWSKPLAASESHGEDKSDSKPEVRLGQLGFDFESLSPGRLPVRRNENPPPLRAAGERYVERDDVAPSGFARKAPASVGKGMRFEVGETVQHKTFGPGRVLDVDAAADAVTVQFPGWAPKRIKSQFLVRDSDP